MYDDLIAALRNMSKMGTKYGMAVVKMREAADAIEELANNSSKLDSGFGEWIPVTEPPESEGE